MGKTTLEDFEKHKQNLIKRKSDREKPLREAIANYEKIMASEMPRKERSLTVAKNIIAIKKRAVDQIEDQLEFLRPCDDKDMEYRKRQYNEFPKIMKSLIPKNSLFRFHGCPIYAAKRIIESGEISSSVNRIGIETSYDAENQISVTTIDTIETTIQGYTNLLDDLMLPAGCVFVVLPKDEAEAQIRKIYDNGKC